MSNDRNRGDHTKYKIINILQFEPSAAGVRGEAYVKPSSFVTGNKTYCDKKKKTKR